MELIDWIGVVAGALTSISYLPQLYKIWKTKSAGDISTLMFTGLYLGIALWCWYAVKLHAVHMLIANGITLVLMSGILLLKYCYRNNKPAPKLTQTRTSDSKESPAKLYG